MARRCFFSFHYARDSWRVQTIKNINSVEGQPLLRSNKWEEVERGGYSSIKKWIDDNMSGTSCLIVLAGTETAGRRWVNYEIATAWKEGKGVLAIHIHNLLDQHSHSSPKGLNPFRGLTVDAAPLSQLVKCYDPPFSESTQVYAYIKNNIATWIEEAIYSRRSA